MRTCSIEVKLKFKKCTDTHELTKFEQNSQEFFFKSRAINFSQYINTSTFSIRLTSSSFLLFVHYRIHDLDNYEIQNCEAFLHAFRVFVR